MLHQKKIFAGELNPIIDLVNYEKSINKIYIDKPVIVQLATDGKTLLLTHGDVQIRSNVDRPIKHQLGGRAWGDGMEYKHINNIWEKKFFENRSELELELADVFKKNDLTIKYKQDNRGKNNIYGIVTPHFVDVNQIEFRQNFIEQICSITALVPKSENVSISKFGQITEFFKFDNPGFQTSYKYGLVYARNNGYEAYRATWGRLILCCTNGLTVWEGQKQFRWKHTREIKLSDFILDTVNEGLENQIFMETRINTSKETTLNQSTYMELLDRLSLALASKERIRVRLEAETKNVGCNEWALSQALTWLGTHKSGIPFGMKQQLTDLGTDILEKSLTTTLLKEQKVDFSKKYGLILPKEF